jgi:hypothetical protein
MHRRVHRTRPEIDVCDRGWTLRRLAARSKLNRQSAKEKPISGQIHTLPVSHLAKLFLSPNSSIFVIRGHNEMQKMVIHWKLAVLR